MNKLENIPNKMHALVLHEVGKLTYELVDNYKLKKDNVLVKMEYTGICSSDIERVFVNGTYHFPTIPGHEMAGKIVCVNDEDTELLGKRVTIFPMLPCFDCDACKKEEYAQCSNYNYFGSRCDGGFSEYLLVPKWNLVFTGDIGPKVACLSEPSAVSLHATNILNPKEGDNVAISGTGTIAVIIGYFCKYKGANVTIIGRNKNKLETIKELGFDVVNTSDIDKYKNTFDGVVEAVGSNESINQSIDLVKTFGKVVMVGNPKEDVLLNKNTYWKILRKQLVITGSWNSSYGEKINDWQEVIKYMVEGKIPFDRLITKEFNLEESDDAFKFLMDKNTQKFKVVFKIDKEER